MVITEYLLKKLKLDTADVKDPQVRARYGYLEGWVSLLANAVLFTAKIIAGIFTGSISIMADAVHTASDIATSVVVIWGFAIAKKPADEEHPFGHGRMENIATLIIAVLVCVVGAGILKEAFERIAIAPQVKSNFLILIALGLAVIVKEWLARFSFSLGNKIESTALKADAIHHRSDAISTVFVIGAAICSMFKIFVFDAVFGLLVAIYVIYTGIMLIKESSTYLLGKAVSKELKIKIQDLAKSVEGVQGVHDIIAHDYGTHKAISLHVEVSRNLSVILAHDIASKVESIIAENIFSSPIVHIDYCKGKCSVCVNICKYKDKDSEK